MTLTLLLPWFPILLGVGVGGRLLGRTRGFGLGLVCALFWILLVQASSGSGVWQDPWLVMSIVTGATAIFAIGGWAAASPPEATETGDAIGEPLGVTAKSAGTRHKTVAQITAVLDRFEDWLIRYAHDSDRWAKFDEFVRSVLYESVQANLVKTYRIDSKTQELLPQFGQDAFTCNGHRSARRGIVGHVATTGRSYRQGDPSNGGFLKQITDDADESIQWCFAVTVRNERIGVVVVGRVGVEAVQDLEYLQLLERLVAQMWRHLSDSARAELATREDSVSGLSTRNAFLASAEQSLANSYAIAEPVAIAIVAVEGLRDFNDHDKWEATDDLIRELGASLKAKLRADDVVGRFDEARFVLLLRRVDSELATLILTQLNARLIEICEQTDRWGGSPRIRCGVAGSGTGAPSLRKLIASALGYCNRARDDGVDMVNDLSIQPRVGVISQ